MPSTKGGETSNYPSRGWITHRSKRSQGDGATTSDQQCGQWTIRCEDNIWLDGKWTTQRSKRYNGDKQIDRDHFESNHNSQARRALATAVKQDFPDAGQNKDIKMSKDDHQFINMLSQSSKLADGHYSVCLPVRNKSLCMPNNRAVAEQRALNLRKIFARDGWMHS